jgi:UDPglucose--hexose-1-phosphate uridylyltransferase
MRRVQGATADGRRLTYYLGSGPLTPADDDAHVAPHRTAWAAAAAPAHGTVRERRWDRESEEWVVYATARQGRPTEGTTGTCPFCPGAATDRAWHEVERDDFTAAVFENRFAPLGDSERAAGAPSPPGGLPAGGRAEVVLYTPDHHADLGTLSDAHLADLVRVWADRTATLLADPSIRYVFVFENRGQATGATLSHAHGQIYALPFAPPRVRRIGRIESRRRKREGRCPVCTTVAWERAEGARVVDAGEPGWLGYVPFAARMPFELTLAPHRCVDRLDRLSAAEVMALGRLLGRTVRRYDALFGFPLPYMMAILQAGSDRLSATSAPGHLRLAFWPVQRSARQLKVLASSESLGGLFLADVMPEEAARHLREVAP